MPGKQVIVLPLIYDLILWHTPKVAGYPKRLKYGLGERITTTMLDILEQTIGAQYAAEGRSDLLRQANVGLEKLRYLLRLAKDLNCLSLAEYEHAAKALVEIGRMVGGWARHAAACA